MWFSEILNLCHGESAIFTETGQAGDPDDEFVVMN